MSDDIFEAGTPDSRAPDPTPDVTVTQNPRSGRRSRREGSPVIDRLPPHSIEAEQGVIGCIMLSPADCMAECLATLEAGPVSFYDLRHQTLFEVMTEMFNRNEPLTTIAIHDRLKNRQQLENVGGLAYLASLPDTVPSAANLSFYLTIVQEKLVLRRMLQACTDVAGRIYEHEGQVDELVDEFESQALAVRGRPSNSFVQVKECVHRVIEAADAAFTNGGAAGILTGFPELDKLTGGLFPGEVTIIAARPSCGKTSLLTKIFEHVCLDQKLAGGIFSLEMSKESLVQRMICSRGKIGLSALRHGQLSERDFPKFTCAAGALANAPLYIDDSSGLSITQIRSRARMMVSQHGVKVIGVDYMQLAHSTSRQAQSSREREVSDISNGMKAMAKELNIPVIVLSQLNRENEDKRPRLSNLRESGAIEQDADTVMLMSREGKREDESDEASNILLDVAKQRNGPVGDVHLVLMKRYTSFESASRVSDGLPPDHPLYQQHNDA